MGKKPLLIGIFALAALGMIALVLSREPSSDVDFLMKYKPARKSYTSYQSRGLVKMRELHFSVPYGEIKQALVERLGEGAILWSKDTGIHKATNFEGPSGQVLFLATKMNSPTGAESDALAIVALRVQPSFLETLWYLVRMKFGF
jgi:hypothetical protein